MEMQKENNMWPFHLALAAINAMLTYCAHPLHIGRVEMHDGFPCAAMNEADYSEFVWDLKTNLDLAHERKDGTAIGALYGHLCLIGAYRESERCKAEHGPFIQMQPGGAMP